MPFSSFILFKWDLVFKSSKHFQHLLCKPFLSMNCWGRVLAGARGPRENQVSGVVGLRVSLPFSPLLPAQWPQEWAQSTFLWSSEATLQLPLQEMGGDEEDKSAKEVIPR